MAYEASTLATVGPHGLPYADIRSFVHSQDRIRARSNKSTLHHSRHRKDGPKWQRQRSSKRAVTNELVREEWIGDLDWYRYEDWCFEHNLHLDWEDNYWYHIKNNAEELEEEAHVDWEEGQHIIIGRVGASQAGEDRYNTWNWHRDPKSGVWFAAKGGCELGICACDKYGLDDIDEREELWDTDGAEGLVDGEAGEERANRVEFLPSDDWDIVSVASSAWTELDGPDPDIDGGIG